jgi:hypothetical protein
MWLLFESLTTLDVERGALSKGPIPAVGTRGSYIRPSGQSHSHGHVQSCSPEVYVIPRALLVTREHRFPMSYRGVSL